MNNKHNDLSSSRLSHMTRSSHNKRAIFFSKDDFHRDKTNKYQQSMHYADRGIIDESHSIKTSQYDSKNSNIGSFTDQNSSIRKSILTSHVSINEPNNRTKS